MKVIRILIGVGMLGFAFVIYPYYINYIINPLIDVAETLFPSMKVWESAYFAMIPYYTLFIVLFAAVQYMLGKGSILGASNGDKEIDESDTED